MMRLREKMYNTPVVEARPERKTSRRELVQFINT
jgi:hypothetical protein